MTKLTSKPTISALKRADKCAREALELRDKAIDMARAAEAHAASLQDQLSDPAYVRVLRTDLEAFMAANGGWDASPGATKRLRAAVKGNGQ